MLPKDPTGEVEDTVVDDEDAGLLIELGGHRSQDRFGEASLQAGNSEAIIRKHCLDLKSVEEADAFWKIVPMGETLPELEKKDGWYVVAK